MKSIFVSSTFRDMDFERDVLNRNVAPRLNYRLSRYNQTVRILDLRWGVDTSELSEEEASARVLSACFDAIDSCRPYIVVLLGDRYGYIPDESGISVTHMEILRGVLESADRGHVFIYFRDADQSDIPEELADVYIERDADSRVKLEELKAALRRELPDRCRSYKAVWSKERQCFVSDTFEDMISADLEADVLGDRRSIAYRSDLHKQLSENEEILSDQVRYAFLKTEKLNKDAAGALDSDRPYAVIGGGGEGKSVYMSLLCSTVRGRGVRSSILFCGDNAFSSSVRNAAEALLHLLTEASGVEYAYEENSALSYEDIVAALISLRPEVKEKCCFFLDAVDKCEEGMLAFISWCGRFLPEQVVVVFSSRMTPEIGAKKGSFTMTEIRYDRGDYRQMANCILNEHAKTLSEPLINAVLDKTVNPLQLRLLLLRLLDLSKADFDAINAAGGGIEAINKHLFGVISESPSDIGELVLSYLNVLMEGSSDRYFHSLILNLLTFSDAGMYEDDIRRAFEIGGQPWVELDYIEFLERFAFFFNIRDNGRLDLSHDIIRVTLRKDGEAYRTAMCYLIALALADREEHDPAMIHSFFSAAYSGDLPERLAGFVTKYSKDYYTPRGRGLALELQRLYFKDEGKFLLKSISGTESLSELMIYVSMVSSALLSVNDYYEQKTVLVIANYVMSLFLISVRLGTGLHESELFACEQFLRRHDVKEDDIQRFLSVFRRKIAELSDKANPEARDDSPEEMLERVRNAEAVEAPVIWLSLSMKLRAMTNDKKTAARAERILLEMLAMLESGEYTFDEATDTLSYADIYTSLGSACKTLKKWEQGLEYDNKSAQIYKKLYEENPSADAFRKYRERIYNIANMTEAWAIEEKTNAELWERTRQCYEAVYAMELTAVSKGVNERDLVRAASSIFSLGTALLKTGRADEGVQKYREGTALIEDVAGHISTPSLYAELVVHLMECFYQLVGVSMLTEAYGLTAEICRGIAAVAGSDDDKAKESIVGCVNGFSNAILDTINEMHEANDLDGQLTLQRAIVDIYVAFLPLAPYEIRVNIIIISCNIGAILYWQKKDYAEAYEAYRELTRLVEEKDLAAPDKNGQYMDQANARLADVYIRSVVCLEKLGREEELKALIGEAESRAGFIAEHTNALRGDAPYILYTIFFTLVRYQSPLAPIFLLKAFDAIRKDDYDRKAHPKTVRLICEAIQQLRGAANGESG